MPGSSSMHRKEDSRSCQLLPLGLLLLAPLVGHEPSESFDFRYDVLPVLERSGCASAYCHGSATGRGGFKLSLFGSDPLADYGAITQEFGGRRLDFLNVEKSLLLQKPALRIKHGGGRVLVPDSPPYRRLESWIAAGAPFARGPRRKLLRLTLVERAQRVRTLAEFEAASGCRDVTSLARFWSSDEETLRVDPDGRIELLRSGEAFVFARYGGLTARLVKRRPYGLASKESMPAPSLEADRIWLAGLSRLGLRPAGEAEPHVLLRRLYLDLAGRPPTPPELDRFLETRDSDRLGRTAEELLDAADFDRVFARHLARWLEIPEEGRARPHIERQVKEARGFLVRALRERLPFSELARGLLLDGPLAKLVRRKQDPRDRAEYVARTLLGLRIGCARCHDHPLDRWKRAEHLRFSAFFTDPRPRPGGGQEPGILFHPESGQPLEPQLLPLATETPPEGLDRKATLAWFLLDGAREQFSRNIVNRVFSVLIGSAFVTPLDDHRLTNPAVHEKLLDHYARAFREDGYRLRTLVLGIVRSSLYASASRYGDSRPRSFELHHLALRRARTLGARELMEAAAAALGLPASLEPLPEALLAQQLALRNGDLLAKLLRLPGNQVDAVIDFGSRPAEQIQELYRIFLSRAPADHELRELLPRLGKASDPNRFLRDLAFALLASREFGALR